MKKLLDEMDAVRVDDRRFIDLNDQFHERIYAASHRPKLEALIGDLRGASASYLRLMGVTHELSATELAKATMRSTTRASHVLRSAREKPWLRTCSTPLT